MDFIFVTDIARANLMAANSSITDDVLNIASGTETSLTELAAALGRVMGVDRPPEYGPARKATPVWRRLADVGRQSGRSASRRKSRSKTASASCPVVVDPRPELQSRNLPDSYNSTFFSPERQLPGAAAHDPTTGSNRSYISTPWPPHCRWTLPKDPGQVPKALDFQRIWLGVPASRRTLLLPADAPLTGTRANHACVRLERCAQRSGVPGIWRDRLR